MARACRAGRRAPPRGRRRGGAGGRGTATSSGGCSVDRPAGNARSSPTNCRNAGGSRPRSVPRSHLPISFRTTILGLCNDSNNSWTASSARLRYRRLSWRASPRSCGDARRMRPSDPGGAHRFRTWSPWSCRSTRACGPPTSTPCWTAFLNRQGPSRSNPRAEIGSSGGLSGASSPTPGVVAIPNRASGEPRSTVELVARSRAGHEDTAWRPLVTVRALPFGRITSAVVPGGTLTCTSSCLSCCSHRTSIGP
jgi:hypothetical protein